MRRALCLLLLPLAACEVNDRTCTPETDAVFCSRSHKDCGRFTGTDNCGEPRTVASCGECTRGKTCGGGGALNVCGSPACTPATCAAQAKDCGALADGCGGTLQCGDCPTDKTCGAGGVANVCGTGTCTPTTCAGQGKDCGPIGDGCGGTLQCGDCPTGKTCGAGGVANVCGTAGAFDISVALHLDKTSVGPGETITGSVTYRNGSTTAVQVGEIVIAARPPGGTHSGGPYLDLSPTTPGQTVQPGASMTATASRSFTAADPSGQWECYATWRDAGDVWHDGPSVFFTVQGCQAGTCTSLKKDCGSVPDGCGGTLDCGTCTGGQVCGAVTANVCGACTPKTCTQLGAACGVVGDGCGGTVDCGACTGGNRSLWLNCGGPNYWSSDSYFVDLMKQADDWRPSSGTVAVDANGWITSLAAGQTARTYVAFDVSDGHYPTGTYTLLWEGKGTFSLGGTVNRTITTTGTGSTTFDITTNKPSLYLDVTAVDPPDHLRNLRIVTPGHAADYQTNPWNPDLLTLMGGFGGIRFMDFHATNAGYGQPELVAWSERTPEGHRNQSRGHEHGGAAYELSIDLVNRLGVHGWWNVPHNASDDFVLQFATLLRDRVGANSRIHIELSNELWNGMFGQVGALLAKANAAGISGPDWQKVLRYQGRRTKEIAQIFKTVFGASFAQRVRIVVASQSGNTGTGDSVLSFEDTYQSVHVYATAPYFGGDCDSDPAAQTWTLDQLFTHLTTTSMPEALSRMTADKALADQFGLQLLAYEGGQHLVGYGPNDNHAAANALFIQANRDPRMKALYATYFDAWKARGGKAFCIYSNVGTPGRYGSWGLAEYLSQPRASAPKLDAVLTWMAGNAPWYSP